MTAKPSSYTFRAWEVVSIESIDILDSLGSNIRFDTCGTNLVRVLPSVNDLLNNEWITDKVRFCVSGLATSRVAKPIICNVSSGARHICS